jgi:hypothetical protein
MEHRLKGLALSGSPRKLGQLAGPLLPEWFHTIWRICVFTARGDEIRAELLAAFDRTPASQWSQRAALRMAKNITNATTVEPESSQCVALADRIGILRTIHDTSEIALLEAQSLINAIIVEPDPDRRVVLADRISILRTRYETAEIAIEEARALMGATWNRKSDFRAKLLADPIGVRRANRTATENGLQRQTGFSTPSSPTEWKTSWCTPPSAANRLGETPSSAM